ncbi:MAG: efflux transporter outer membrane subunit [Acidiphilium sp.]|nr:efflux transporter outer membrane subunit [Acidiphilium sp.]MDD4936691.1 efflux transporter outer membrane subunit [Acidiphilium sp.]
MTDNTEFPPGRSSKFRWSGRRTATRPLVLVLALGVSACSVGPHLKLTKTVAPAHYGAHTPNAPLSAVTMQPALSWTARQNAAWWQMFHAPQLDTLIAEGFQHSPTLAAAKHALTAANEYAVAQEGSLFPSIGLGGGLQRNTSIRSVIGGRVVVPGKPFTLASAEGQISYSVDAFGLQTDLIRNSKARAAVSAAELDDARIFLAGNVASAAISFAGDRAELTLRRRIVQAESKILTVMNSDYKFGAITDESVEQQKAVLAASKAEIPLLTSARDDARHLLDYLVGRMPDQPVPQINLSDLVPPATVPVVIPSVLIEHRPDIVAAMAGVKAASAAVDASTAAMYPNFNINAAFGAGSAVALFNPASEIFSLASSFAAPLFEGGKLSADKRASYALWQQATSQYRNTVLNAFRQVADRLRTLQGDEAALDQRRAAAQFASSALRLARERYDAGAITYQTLLNAELLAQTDQVSALSARIDCYQDIVTLFVAMGDAAPTASAPPLSTADTTKAASKS